LFQNIYLITNKPAVEDFIRKQCVQKQKKKSLAGIQISSEHLPNMYKAQISRTKRKQFKSKRKRNHFFKHVHDLKRTYGRRDEKTAYFVWVALLFSFPPPFSHFSASGPLFHLSPSTLPCLPPPSHLFSGLLLPLKMLYS
jgi:hypothetical protein